MAVVKRELEALPIWDVAIVALASREVAPAQNETENDGQNLNNFG
jgi:hypothetical protein